MRFSAKTIIIFAFITIATETLTTIELHINCSLGLAELPSGFSSWQCKMPYCQAHPHSSFPVHVALNPSASSLVFCFQSPSTFQDLFSCSSKPLPSFQRSAYTEILLIDP